MIKLLDKYDIVIIGAGPAGSVTARFAAENGASVLVLERDREAGIPVRCAEGVSHRGIAPYIEIDKLWIATTITKARLVSPDGKFVDMNQNATGYVLERRIFDPALCSLASEFGATFLTKANATSLIRHNNKICGVKFNYLDEEHTVKCDIVIGADGVESRVGRWAGLETKSNPKDIDTCAQYTLTNIEVADDRCDFFFGNDLAPGGYVWIFPKSKTSANVGLALAGSRTDKKSPKAYLDEFVKDKFPNASLSYTVLGGIPISPTLKDISTDNVLLVGDAAHQVNPITGGGIVQAMIAAELCGKVAAEAVKTNNFTKKFLKQYDKQWNKRLGANQKFMYSIKEIFMDMTDERFNNLLSICLKVPQDKFTMQRLFKEVVKGDPKLLKDMAKAFVVSKFR
jgi:digeranylgeranylglycerophospholipid reductase